MTVSRFFLIAFFIVCTLASSYVLAVLGMSFWASYIAVIPYDTYAFFTCPLSGTCLEYGRDLFIPTWICAGGIVLDVLFVSAGYYFLKDKIKMPSPVKKLFTVIGTKFFSKIKFGKKKAFNASNVEN